MNATLSPQFEALLNIPQVSLRLDHIPINPEHRIAMRNSNCAADIFKALWLDDIHRIERMAMICCSSSHVISFSWMGQGGISGTVCDLRLVAQTALLQNASAVILCHNHPSGSLKPSDPDRRLTKRAKEGLELLDINLLDHLIITQDNGYFSFADEGLLY